jgi:hypothetical protein
LKVRKLDLTGLTTIQLRVHQLVKLTKEWPITTCKSASLSADQEEAQQQTEKKSLCLQHTSGFEHYETATKRLTKIMNEERMEPWGTPAEISLCQSTCYWL